MFNLLKQRRLGLTQCSILPVIWLLSYLSVEPIPTIVNQTSIERSQDPSENNHIVETVFRHLVAEHSPELEDMFNFIMLCVDSSSTDPESRRGFSRQGGPRDISDEMFKNMSNLPIPLKKQQQCSYLNVYGEVAKEGEWRPGGVIDNETKQRGLLYTVGEQIGWITDDYVQVFAWYYYGGRAGAGWVCHVKKQDGTWIVTEMERKWIS